MLKLQEVANFLTSELSNINADYDFMINAEVGENRNDGKIQGILKCSTPNMTPVAGVKNVKYKFTITLSVPSSVSNFNLNNIESIINDFANLWNGKEKTFTNGSGLITTTLASSGDFKTEYAQGTMLPLLFYVDINYTENVITSAKKVWLLNDIQIPYISESVILEKDGRTNNISGRNYKQTFMTNQMKWYHFKFNYDTNNNLCSMLQQDILNGDFTKTYSLKYYDGVSFTQANPYTTTVSIFRNADTSAEKPNTAVFDLTFTDVDDGNNSTKYYIALIDYIFDNQSENTKWFTDQASQLAYFNNLVQVGAGFEEIKAPNIDSIVLTSQVYRNTNNYDLFDLMNKNYAIIKAQKGTGLDQTTSYFYYFITQTNIGSNNQILCDLRLDSIQTYYFLPTIEFKGDYIQKAHLNRWIENDDNTVSYDGTITSKLFEREEMKDVAKRLKDRSKLIYSTSSYNYKFIHTICWIYATMKIIPDGYNVLDNAGTTKQISVNQTKTGNWNELAKPVLAPGTQDQYVLGYEENTEVVNYGVVTVVAPITTTGDPSSGSFNNSIYFRDTDDHSNAFKWTCNALTSFIEKNGGYSNVLSLRLSIKPPIYQYTRYTTSTLYPPQYRTIRPSVYTDLIDVYLEYKKDTTHNEIKYLISLDNPQDVLIHANQPAITYINPSDSTDKQGLMFYNFDYQEATELSGSPSVNINFSKTEAQSDDLNPKLNSIDYKTLRVSFAGNTFDFDIQKMNIENPTFSYFEMITPDITKGYLSFKDTKNGVYGATFDTSFNGLMFTNDFSLPISNNQLETYLANNKNAYLSFQNSQNLKKDLQTVSNIQTVTSGVASMFTGGIAGAIGGAVNTASNLIASNMTNQLNLAYNDAQFNLSMDNMRSAPQTLSNANGNAIFQTSVRDFGIYAELWEALPNELKMANDIMKQSGFTVNLYGSVKDYDNIRSRYNYVKAILGSIENVPMSNIARQDLRQRFANGVRFWKIDTVDFTTNNPELILL